MDYTNGKPPKFLYHYTTVDILVLILQHRTIRFKPLNTLDDKYERMAKDYEANSRFLYISSWIEKEDESIPMWNMYAGMSAGVRLKLRSDMFHLYKITKSECRRIERTTLGEINFDDFVLSSPFRWGEIFERRYVSVWRDDISFPFKVKYTDSTDELVPVLSIRNFDGEDDIDLNWLGMHKPSAWDFQGEWRYLIFALPVGKNEDGKYRIFLKKMNDWEFNWKIDHIDVPIKSDVFCDMEITMSPMITESNRVVLELLKREFNPNMIVRESALYGYIRG